MSGDQNGLMGPVNDDAAGPGETPAAPGSMLASLRERRAKAKEELFLDLPVPRYDPPLYVRFKPLDQSALVAGQKLIDAGKKDREVVTKVNAGYLAGACLGLFEVADGEKVSIDPDDRSTDPGEWPTFGPRVAELLGEPGLARAVDVVRSLYLTDGDIIATAGELAVWSGYTGEKLEAEFEGN